MIAIINKNNMNFPDDDFLTKEEVSTELENNPYGNYLLLIEEDKIIGYIYYSDIYERAEINQFEVKPTHRNCGKGNELLKYLIDNKGIALSRDKILNNVWNYDYYGDSRTIDSHIKKIRHKLGKKGKYIETIRGVGYKFEVK